MGKKDDTFGRMAIAQSLVTEEQLAECQAHLAQLRQQGTTTTIARVMVQRGVLTTEQAKSIVGEMKKPRLSHIGQFRLIERIGQGGMGTVYKARQESLDKTVAVKVLSPALARRGDYVQRFLREARSCGQLSHPNIVLGISVGEADGYYYFAMEYVDGPTVKDVMRREGKIDERRALEITLAMAHALEHAHEQRIVHRDIKPGNILLTTDGTPKLADLGLAKEVETDQSITQAAIPIGTPYYISPEQVRGQQDVDQRADLYAMGATLYHMVTGVVPFEGATAAVVMTHHLNDPIPDAREHAPDVSGSLVSIIRHAMAKDRDARYQSATELREDVEAALAGTSLPHAGTASAQAPEARSERLTQRRARAAAKKRRTLLVAGAVGGAIVLALALFLVLRPKGTAPQARTAPQPAPVTPPHPKAKRPRPKPRTKQPAAQKPKVDPESVLRELVEWAATAADRATVEKRFSSFVIAHAGTATAGKAKSHLAELKAQWAARDRVRTTVEGLIEKGEFAAALRTLGKPSLKLPDARNAALIGELKDKVASAIESHVKQRMQEADEAARNGDLAGARGIYEKLAALGLPEASEASRQAMARLAKVADQRAQRRARRAFAEALHACESLIKAGKLVEAGRLFAATEAKGDERLAALLKDGAADVERVAKLFAAIEAEVNALAAKGGRARIRGIKRPVARAAGGVIACKLGGRTSEFGIHDLTLRDLEEFQSFKAAPLGAIAYQLYRGEVAEAKAELEKLAATSKDACVARWLEQIEWRKAIGREDEAGTLFAKVRKLVEQKSWTAAFAAVRSLRTAYAETAFVERHAPEINALAEAVATGLAGARRAAETIRPFIDVTAECGGLGTALATLRPSGGWVMDIDNDGRLDVALDMRNAPTPYVPVFLNRSKGKAHFVEATRIVDLATGEEPICWVDLDGDGDLDVVCRGLWSQAAGGRKSDHSKLAIYENRGAQASPMFHLHPTRSLTARLAKAPGFGGYGFGNIAVIDANSDGRSDILAQFVSTKRTLCLFRAVRGKPFVFEDASAEAGFVVRKGGQIATPAHLQVKAWPNYVVFDADGDDRADFILNTDGGMVFRNQGSRGFAYREDSSVKYSTDAGAHTGNNPRIVPAVADYDNDGHIDILVPQNGKNLLLRNEGRRYVDAMHTTGPMATDAADSLWATWADVNNDGLLDLFVCNAGERNRLYIQKTNHAFVDKAEDYGVAGQRDEATNFMAFADFDRDGDVDMLLLKAKGRNRLLLNPTVTDDNHYALNVLVRTALGSIGAKVYLIGADGKVAGLQQICRVEGYNRQTPREAFFGVPAPGQYTVRVVLSSRRRIESKVTLDPSRPNILVIRK